MRYLVLLQKNDKLDPVFSNDNEGYHIYNQDIYDKHLTLSKMYDSNEFLRKHYKKIVKFTHPFETIASTIKSKFIPNCPPLKITNAFMKMYEFLEYIDKFLPKEGTLRMFDVAGAPGMFVFATEFYLQHSSYGKYPFERFKQYACTFLQITFR